MRAAGRVVATALAEMRKQAAVGVSLAELDEVARSVLAEHGATSPFLHYQPSFAHTPFPAVICASVNDAALHGIPGPYKLADGDLVSIDFGATLDGWTGDSAISFTVGTPRPADLRLIDSAERALAAGIAKAVPGGRLGDISAAIGARRQGRRLRLAHRLRRPWRRSHDARVALGAQRRQGGAWPEARGRAW